MVNLNEISYTKSYEVNFLVFLLISDLPPPPAYTRMKNQLASIRILPLMSIWMQVRALFALVSVCTVSSPRIQG